MEPSDGEKMFPLPNCAVDENTYAAGPEVVGGCQLLGVYGWLDKELAEVMPEVGLRLSAELLGGVSRLPTLANVVDVVGVDCVVAVE